MKQGLFLVALLLAQVRSGATAKESVSLYEASLHTFSIVRSGITIADPVTGIQHPASHLKDASAAGTPDERDLAGGWYNAGDYGKWTMMAAISSSYMLHLYADQEQHGKGDPALLDTAKWGLAWLLKMQDRDGGVRHKVDSGSPAALGRAWGLPPDRDPTVRIASGASTLDTADFAAVMYQASRVLSKSDPPSSKRFYLAAQKAYSWILSHPHVSVQDVFYPDQDPEQEVLWARCERAASGEKTEGLAHALRSVNPMEVSWSNPSLLGLYSLASSRSVPRDLNSSAREAVQRAATTQAEAAEPRPFHVALATEEYTWGSAERVLHRASLFLMADRLRPSPLLHAAAVHQLAWLLGNNAMQHSLVVGFGTNPVQHPYHWSYMVYGKLMPGWAAGGPNSSRDGADPALLQLQGRGTPPARCYADLCSREGSWASNEGQISEEAALLFVTGSLSFEGRSLVGTRL